MFNSLDNSSWQYHKKNEFAAKLSGLDPLNICRVLNNRLCFGLTGVFSETTIIIYIILFQRKTEAVV